MNAFCRKQQETTDTQYSRPLFCKNCGHREPFLATGTEVQETEENMPGPVQPENS